MAPGPLSQTCYLWELSGILQGTGTQEGCVSTLRCLNKELQVVPVSSRHFRSLIACGTILSWC